MSSPKIASSPSEYSRDRRARQTALAGYIGGTLEYFDLYIYASAAALVFGRVFFPDAGSSGALISIATFGVAYVARPLGAVIFGNLADKLGRKNTLVIILLLMGSATFLIGCLPSYEQAGHLAPTLLVLLRLLQGVSTGGETASASSMIVEVSPPAKRAFYTSWVSNGIVSGFVLAYLAFLPISLLPEEQLLSWGWRVPFWSSVLVMVVGFIIRSKLSETESFEDAKAKGELASLPMLELVKTHYIEIIRVILCTFALAINTVIAIFGLSYATGVAHIPQTTMLLIAITSNAAALVTQPLMGALADRIGRKAVFICGTLASAGITFVYFQAIAAGNVPMIALSTFAIISFFYAGVNAIYPAFFAEQFSLPVRTSGMAISQQIGQIVAGFAPTVAMLIIGDDKSNWLPIAWILAILCIVASLAAATSSETAGVPQRNLGAKKFRPSDYAARA